MRRWLVMGCCLLLAACASAPPAVVPPVDPALLHDEAFGPPSETVSAADLFALSPEMTAYLHSSAATGLRDADPRRPLIDLLYRRQQLALEYDSTRTRTAAEAFQARAGNCLSLVIMTAAFAKAIGLPVQYRHVFVDEAWSRSGNLYVASGHVNLALETAPSVARYMYSLEPQLVVDFVPAEELRGQRVQTLAERTIVAMFMNNRAAEALVAGRLDDAYWYAREALRQDPHFLVALNTLGVIYLRHGEAAEAERVLAEALRQEPANTKVMGNLVQALRRQQRDAEADALAARLAQIEPYPPFHFFNAGLAAMRAHDYETARAMFAKEIQREAYYHEFHFWLAQAELALGNVTRARQQLELAAESSTTPREHALYAAKLDRLRAARRLQ